MIHNPQVRPLTADLRLIVRVLGEQELQLWLNGERWAKVRVGTEQQSVDLPNLVLPPGESKLEFRSDSPGSSAEGDSRELGFAFYAIDFTLHEEITRATR
jgi:hypothetical protein